MPEPGYCDHGKSLKARCFFCGRKASAPRPARQEPRNPPAIEQRRRGITINRKAAEARRKLEETWAAL